MRNFLSSIAAKLFNKNTALFLGGLGGVIHETVWVHSDRPTLLILFAAMMGLPAFLSAPAAAERQLHKDHLQDEIDGLEFRLKNLKEEKEKSSNDKSKDES